MSIHYDDMGINRGILLDLPIREATGIVTQDVAKPHHPMTMVNTPTWTTLDSGLGVMTMDGVSEHLRCVGASCADLDFTTSDYSMGAWIYLASGGASMSQDLIVRFSLNVSGWELYSYTNGLITMRHHHAAGATTRTGFYSAGWAFNTWYFLLLTRSGTGGQFYRGTIDGTFGAVTTPSDTMIDPETCASNLYIACNNGAAGNFFKGRWWRWRVWDRALTLAEGGQEFERSVRWFA